MVLSLFIFVGTWAFFIISTILIYRTARSNGHAPWFWVLMNFLGFIIVPTVLQVGIGIFLGILIANGAINPDSINILSILLWLVFFVASIAFAFFIMKKVSLLKEEEAFDSPPEPGAFKGI